MGRASSETLSRERRLGKLFGVLFLSLCVFITATPTVSASTVEITEVTVQDGLTREVSNDTAYFYSYGTGQSVVIDVEVTNFGDAKDVLVGITLFNSTDTGINPDNVIENATLKVTGSGGTNSTRFNWTVNSTTVLPTGVYNISAFAKYLKNATANETVYNNTEYLKFVSLKVGNFWMRHTENNSAAGDVVEFYQEITNLGSVVAEANFEVTVIKDDNGPNGTKDGTYQVSGSFRDTTFDISSGGEFDIEPGETERKSFFWTPTETEACIELDYEWNARSLFKYGYSFYGPTFESDPNSVAFRNLTYEYVTLENEGIDNSELAPGTTVSGLVDIAIWLNQSNSTVHERRGWVVDDGGSIVLDLVPHVTADLVNAGTLCTSEGKYSQQVSFNGLISQSFSPNKTYTVVMSIDHGVPRGDYSDTTTYRYSNFNDNVTADFNVVLANLTNIYLPEEAGYGKTVTIYSELENLGTNSISSGNPYVKLTISNSTYNTTQNSVVTLSSLQKKNVSFTWTPQPSDLAPGLYNVTATYHYGYAGTTSKTVVVEVVSLSIANVSATAVAPYETSNVTVNVSNSGSTNVTLTLLNVTINATVHLGTRGEAEVPSWYIFNYSFYFNSSRYPFVNGSYTINTNLTYGGVSSISTDYNITLLPVGVKSFSAPEHVVNATAFNVTAVLKNLASNNVTISLNLTSNTSVDLNQSDVVAVANSETTVYLRAMLNGTGTRTLYLLGNYTGLPSSINRSSEILIVNAGVESFNIAEDYAMGNESFTATAVIKNTGGSALAVGLTLSSSISGELNQTSITVAAGSTATVPYSVSVGEPGTHVMTLSLNYTGLQNPITSTDSIYIVPVVIQSLSAPSFAYNATPFNITVTLRNLGSTNITADLNLTSNLNGSIENRSVFVAGGQDNTSTFTVTLTYNGTHAMNVTLGYSPMPTVLFNTTQIGISQPDLSISSADLYFSTTTPTEGTNVTINATVHNEGTLVINDTTVELRVNGTSIENRTLSFAPNCTNTTTFSWTNVTIGAQNVTIIIDPDTNVSEYNETNNNVTRVITVYAAGASVSTAGVGAGGGGGGVAPAITSTFTTLSSATMATILNRFEFKFKQFNSISLITGGEALSLAGTLISVGEYPEVEEVDIGFPKPVRPLSGDIYRSSSELALSKYKFANKVVIARGDKSPDSLAAVAYARANNIPILLTKPNDLPEDTYNAVKALSPEKIIIIGESDAVSSTVGDRLGGIGKVERVGGKDRFETALLMAATIKNPDFIVITDGNDPDIEAAIISAGYKMPLLYVNGDEIPDEVKEYLKSPEIYLKKVVYGPGVSEAVKKQIEGL